MFQKCDIDIYRREMKKQDFGSNQDNVHTIVKISESIQFNIRLFTLKVYFNNNCAIFVEDIIVLYTTAPIIQQLLGQAAEILLNMCQRLKDKFQLPWRMISLVDVILKYAKENQGDAWSRIEEAFLEFRALAAVEAARYTYHHIPYPGLYSTAAAALYPPVYLPSMSIYHHPSSIFSAPSCSSPTSHSPSAGSTPIRPGSRT